jgi:hypothetical protein
MEHCLVCGQMVVLDQTRKECGHKHGCDTGTACPLQKYFTGIDVATDQPKKDGPIPCS